MGKSWAAARRLNPVCAALVALGLATHFGAAAQSTQAEPKKDDRATDSVGQLDRVVITASKRSEKLREVAGAVTALQGGDLEARGARDQEDLFKLTPGVQFNKLEGDTSVITIRGIGTSASGNFVQSTTGIYIEDVPFNDPYIFRTAPDVAPFDLQRVEVLRGPQGVLFGSSSMGGAVRYLFNKPNLKATDFSLLGSVSSTSGGGTNHGEYAMGNLPLSDNAGLRVVLFNRDESGYVDDTARNAKNTNALHQSGGRLLATFAPIKALNITALYMTQATKTDDSSNITNLATVSKALALASPRKSQFDLFSVQMDYDFDDLRLTSNTGYLTKDWTGATDLSRFAAFYGPGAYAATNEKSKASSQELRLSSTGTGPLAWLAGVFYQRYTYDQKDTLQAAAFALPSLIKSTATESSVFAQGDYTLANGVTVGLGGRYFRTQNDIDSNVNFVPGKAGSSESGFTPRASVKFKFAGDNLAYALVSKGYRFGGINITQFNPNPMAPNFVTPPTYDSDSLINYEVGLRLSPTPTVRVDATVFLLDWKGLQVNIPRPGDGFGYTANVGKARSQGLELGVTWTPVQGFTAATAMAYTDAKTKEFYASSTGPVPSGTPLPGTPKFQIANQATYSFAGPAQTSSRAAVTHTYVGKSFNDLFKTAEQGGYSVIDARLAFATQHWELTVFANNLLNKKGVAGVQAFPGFYTDYFINRPRTVGASVRFDL